MITFRPFSCVLAATFYATSTFAQTRPLGVDSATGQFIYNPSITITVTPPSEATEPMQALRYWVATGSWKQVTQILSTLSPQDATELHTRIVRGLLMTADNPVAIAASSGGEPQNKPPAGGRPAASAASVFVGDLLHPEDVLDIADSLPPTSTLSTSTAAQLGQLLGKTIGATGLPDGVRKRLHAGTIHLGGSEMANVSATVVFLLAAGQPELAKTFLPDEKATFSMQSPELAILYQQCLLKSADQLDSIGNSTAASETRTMGLQLTIKILNRPLFGPAAEALIKQVLELSERIDDYHFEDAWFSDLIARHDAKLPAALADLALPLAPSGGQANYNARVAALTRQHHIVDLINGQPADLSTQSALRLFAMNWATEADFTRDRLLMQPHEITLGDARTFKPSFTINPGLIKEIAPETLLQLEPPDRWSKEIESDDLPRFDNDRLALLMASGQRAEAMSLISEMARADSSPQAEEKIAGNALLIWVLQNMPVRIAISPFAMPPLPKGVPTARATQIRNLDALVEMLAKVKEAYHRPLSGPTLPTLFDYVHSQAEVFTLVEIERVFGPCENLDAATLIELVNLMQANLRKVWQSDQVQAANGTNRTDDQRTQQVLQGYATLATILERYLATAPSWQLYIELAVTRFEQADICLGSGGGFAKYTDLREGAFTAIHQAAAEYAKNVTDAGGGKETIDVYSIWFAMALGAKDLAALNISDSPSDSELQRLRNAIHALPGKAANRHVDRFASSLADQLLQLAPDVKERITRNGLFIAGGSPLAGPMHALMQSYADLLTELRLQVTIDKSSPQIGHEAPFGLIVSLDHTNSLEAEVGGFQKYILSPNQGVPLTDGRRVGVDYRKNFQKHLMDALSKAFQVQDIVWAPETVRSRPIEQPGWSNTPLAYVVAKAKDASVDQIPPVQLDIDFNDRMNMVILPVTSPLVMVDASADSTSTISDVTLDERLNDHDLATGVLKLEIISSGRGLMPALDHLIDLTRLERFNVKSVIDGGLKVDRFDTNPDDSKLTPEILSQRAWTIVLTPKDSIAGETTFRFPPAVSAIIRRPDVAVTYHRYADADVVETGPSVLIHGISVPAHRPLWLLVAVPITLLGILLLVARIMLRRRSFVTAEPEAVAAPQKSESLFATLKRLQRKRQTSLDAVNLKLLEIDIRELESEFFSAGNRGTSGTDIQQRLESLNTRW